jgi:hypothetical protein
MSLGIHSKVGCATHEQFANSIIYSKVDCDGDDEFASGI